MSKNNATVNEQTCAKVRTADKSAGKQLSMYAALPFYDANAVQGDPLFLRALDFHEKAIEYSSANDAQNASDCYLHAVMLYVEAFHCGAPEACVNLLSICVPAMNRYKEANPGEPSPYMDYVLSYILNLKCANNPAGTFYQAFCLMNNLLNTEDSNDANFEKGLSLMETLATNGYEPAVKYVEQVCADSSDG